MTFDLIVAPWDSGLRAVRMGHGPLALLEAGLEGRLEELGHRSTLRILESAVEPPTENAVAFDLARSIAARVAEARARGHFPLVLAGNCISTLGVVAGLSDPGPSVVWMDAHGDFNTPETSRSAFLDGMAAAVVTGACWTAATATVPGFSPVPESRFYLVGTRDLDTAEEQRLASSAVTVIGAPELRSPGGMERALAGLTGAPGPVHLHVDLDVLDPDGVGPANALAARGGLFPDEVRALCERITRSTPIAACTLASYDPSCDPEGMVSDAALEIVAHLAGLVASVRPS